MFINDSGVQKDLFDTPIYKTAAAKVIALKDQASEYEISNFKSCLQEWDDQETLNALGLKQINKKIIVEINRKTT